MMTYEDTVYNTHNMISPKCVARFVIGTSIHSFACSADNNVYRHYYPHVRYGPIGLREYLYNITVFRTH